MGKSLQHVIMGRHCDIDKHSDFFLALNVCCCIGLAIKALVVIDHLKVNQPLKLTGRYINSPQLRCWKAQVHALIVFLWVP